MHTPDPPLDGIAERVHRTRRFLVLSIAAVLVCGAVVPAGRALAQQAECIAGFAGPYACKDVDLLAIVPSGEIVGTSGDPSSGSDMWGWTDPETGREYALQGLSDAVAFIDLTDPANPVFVGHLPAPADNFLWRDLKVFDNHVYIVGDFSPTLPGPTGASVHGLQIFDLTRLRAGGSFQVFTEDAVYAGFDEAHNIAINEDTGIGYVLASDTCGAEFHILDLKPDPLNPTFLGCFDSGLPGAAHDAQCVVYRGPDKKHRGKEICLAFMEAQFSIIDMTDKSGPLANLDGPKVLATKVYEGLGYAHQGWFDESQSFVASNDELDELNAFTGGSPHNTHTYVWDARDLDNPVHIATYTGPTGSIDHNHYFNGRFLHQANYTAGYRVLDAADIANGNLTEIAFFDTFPPNADPAPVFAGLWSGYPFFDSGVVAVSQIDGGELFILQPHLPDDAGEATDVTGRVELRAANAAFDGSIASFDLRLENTSSDTISAPLRAEIVSLESQSGDVTAANADNGEPAEGAFWRYDERLNGDDELRAGETSQARRLAFNDESGEPFSVTFRVLSGAEPEAGASGDSGGGSLSAGTLIRLTVDPLLGTLGVERF